MAQTKIEQGLLKFTEATDYLKIPTGTTAQRPSSPNAGYIRFNTTISGVETYDGTKWVEIGVTPPTFSSVDYPGSTTALDPAGGESLVINGDTFNVGITVTIGGTTPSTITRNSKTQLTVTTPAKTAGTYDIVFTNTDGGTATATNAVSYNGIPAFTNAAGSLGSVKDGNAINFSVAATEPDGGAITYAITSGALPSGASLNTTTGAITGTAPSVSADTTSNFTITATDNENQTASRAYSITITPILPSDNFQIVTYTGTSATQPITGVGFKPDLVWIHARTATDGPVLYDTTRGIYKRIYSHATAAEQTLTTSLISFDTGGFSLGSSTNENNNGTDYVAWCWKANGGTTSSNTDGTITSTVQTNQNLGFSIISYTGNGTSGATIGHGLTVAPELLMFKRLNTTESWNVWSSSVSSKVGFLNLTDAFINYSVLGTSTSTITLNNGTGHNASSAPYICYAFASIESFSKFGTYSGNSSDNGPIVETGFEPAFVMVKRVDNNNIYNPGGSWFMWDNKRELVNPRKKYLYANSSNVEASDLNGVDFLSNGFQIKDDYLYINETGGTYLYMAFAADPDTTSPTLADSFNTVTYTGNGSSSQSITGLGFKPNWLFTKRRDSAGSWVNFDSVRGASQYNFLNLTSAEGTGTNYLLSFDVDGFTVGSNTAVNTNGASYSAFAFKADDNEPTIFGRAARTIYKFEDNINDVAGRNNGGYSNVTFTTGKFNKAAEFNGTTSYAYSSSAFSGISSSQFSVSCWVKFDSVTTNQNIIMGRYTYTNSDQQFIIRLNASSQWQLSKYFGNGSGEGLTTTETASANTWYHVVSVYDNTKMSIYVDGVLLKTEVGTGSANSSPTSRLEIGGYQAMAANDSNRMDGLIDQIRIYDGVLGQVQVTELYNETASDNDNLFLGGLPETIISANTNAGFSIVKYTGDGVAGKQIPHGLSAAPEMIIVKNLDITQDWSTYNQYLDASPEDYRLILNGTIAKQSVASWNNTAPNSTAFTVGSGTAVNGNGNEHIAYCFHSVSGYSKIGSYLGNGTAGHSITGLGFQPDWIMIKGITSADNWFIFDSVRGDSVTLNVNLSAAEYADTGVTSFDSDGFTLGSGAGENRNGDTYIYAAFKIN